MGVVVDSSIFVAAERGRFDWVGFHAEIGAERLYITVMTLAELLHGAEREREPVWFATGGLFVARAVTCGNVN